MAPQIPSLISTWDDEDLAERLGDEDMVATTKYNERWHQQKAQKAEAERLVHEVEERRAHKRAEREARAALLWAAEEERHERACEAAEKGKGKVSNFVYPPSP